jgi:hypothetical protein
MIQLSKGDYMFEKLLGLVLIGTLLAVAFEFARIMPTSKQNIDAVVKWSVSR